MAEKIVQFRGEFNAKQMIQEINKIESALSGLSISDSLNKKFNNYFENAKKSITQISSQIDQGFSSSRDIDRFEKEFNKLEDIFSKIRTEANFLNLNFKELKLTSEQQKTFENLKKNISDIRKESASLKNSLSGQIGESINLSGMSLPKRDINNLVEAIQNQEDLTSALDKYSNKLVESNKYLKEQKELAEQAAKEIQESYLYVYSSNRVKNYEAAQGQANKLTKKGSANLSANERNQLNELNKYLADYSNIYKEAQADLVKLNEQVNKFTNESRNSQRQIENQERIISNMPQLYQILVNASEKYSNSSNDVKTRLEAAENALKEFKSTITQNTQTPFDNMEQDIQGFLDAINRARTGVSGLDNEMEKLNSKESFFSGLISKVGSVISLSRAFDLVEQSVRRAWQEINELDKSFTEIAVVSDMTTSELWDQYDVYSKIAQEVGASTNDAVQTSALYYQQGKLMSFFLKFWR